MARGTEKPGSQRRSPPLQPTPHLQRGPALRRAGGDAVSGTGQGHQRGKGARMRSEEEPEPPEPRGGPGLRSLHSENGQSTYRGSPPNSAPGRGMGKGAGQCPWGWVVARRKRERGQVWGLASEGARHTRGLTATPSSSRRLLHLHSATPTAEVPNGNL